jgi:hypothetical protein
MGSCGLAAISHSGYQIRVERDFDSNVLRRFVGSVGKLTMFGLGAATGIYVAVGPTDMRKSFEGPFGLVKERLGCSALSGHLFLFVNARRNRLKVLYWDGYCDIRGYGTRWWQTRQIRRAS